MGHELKLSQSDATSPSLPHWWVLHIQGTCECDYSDYPHYAPAAQRHCHQEAKLHNTMHSGATPLLRGCSRKNIFCQKIFDLFSFQATEMVLTSKWGRIQQEIQI